MTADDLLMNTRLLGIIARKLGHDYLLLRSNTEPPEKKCVSALFGQYDNYDTELLEVSGKPVSIKYVDAEGRHFRSNVDMYRELSKRLYVILESGGKLSDGKSEVDASAVPEFMIECALNGIQ